MKKIEVYSNTTLVGFLGILDRQSYSFSYAKSWLDSNQSYAIDPLLPLENHTFYDKHLWGAFCDVSPDRWGKVIQMRNAQKALQDDEYMLGVSDYFRIGALRLRQNAIFVSECKEVPKLLHLSQIQDSTLRVENDEYTQNDLKILLAPSSSIGGARPKASVQDNNILYIAKFPSISDTHSVILWEAVMLKLSKIAKINTADFKLANVNQKKVLLIKRFDRDFANNERIPFMSAMTLLGTNERDEKNIKSYIDIANKLDSNNKEELFRRMVFNALFGNIDDHLRNHALLYDKTKRKWNLSPAYDLNPMPYEYTKQSHALAFKDCITTPSIELCKNLAKDFEVQDCKFYEILQDCISAGTQYKKIASDFGIKANEINLFANNFEHKDIVLANEMLEKEQLNKANILAKNTQTPQAHKPKPHRR